MDGIRATGVEDGNEEKTVMPAITITHEHEEPNETQVQGVLEDFPGWTFEATVAKDISWDSEVWTNYPCTRLLDVHLIENDEIYISIPADALDGRDVPMEPAHDEMLDQIDRYFGPSPKEREQLAAGRDMERDHVFDELAEHIELHLQDVDPDTLARAADKLRDVYREKSAALEKMRLAARERDFERGGFER